MVRARLGRALVCAAAAALAIGLAARVYTPLFWSHDFMPMNRLHTMGYFRTFSMGQFLLSAAWPYWNALLAGLWTFAIAVAAGNRLLRLGSRPRPVARPRLRTAAAVGLLVLTLPSVALGAWGIANEVRAGGRAEFEAICGRCHAPERPLAYMRSPAAWRITVERMQGKIPGLIADAEKERALRYLLGTRSWTGEQLFDMKCQQACHDTYLRDERRSADAWRRAADRIRLENPFFLTAMQEEEILAYLDAAGMTQAEEPGGELRAQQRLFETKCVECHTLDIIVGPEADAVEDWEPVLRRMREKAPWLYSEEEVLGLVSFIEAMREDPERFARAVPHASREILYGARTGEVDRGGS